jgi:alpha-galactosidase
MADSAGVSLWLDVRNGGSGVELGGRAVRAAEVVTREGGEGESPFEAACAFCRLLCDTPRLPARPVYGANDWYYAYGHSSAQSILDAAQLIVSLSPGGDNRPFMVVDAGWQPAAGDEPANVICGGPYRGSNRRFPDMTGLAAGIRAAGARPGIWIRPLAAAADDSDAWLLPAARALDDSAKVRVLDPSLPDVLDRVEANFSTLHGWGYDLIKHDWASCDIYGRWGFQMGTALTNPGWHFGDRSRTTAEITLALFRAIRRGAGDAVVIGCNTIGHLGAGLFDLQRTGDDTSGRDWERTRKMGVNTLAFRMSQHGAFFAADPDCVGHTAAMPWDLNRRFLDLVARSGAPLFVSFDPATVGPEQARALRDALAVASVSQPMGEPLDWLESTCPSLWRLGGDEARYDWYGEAGVAPVQ